MDLTRPYPPTVARLLEAAGLGTLADGLPTLYAGPYPPGAPDAFKACRLSSAEKPEKYLANAGTALHRCTVTVLVCAARGPDGYSEGSARARAAWETLYDAHPEGYVHVDVGDVGDGGPTHLGGGRGGATTVVAYCGGGTLLQGTSTTGRALHAEMPTALLALIRSILPQKRLPLR